MNSELLESQILTKNVSHGEMSLFVENITNPLVRDIVTESEYASSARQSDGDNNEQPVRTVMSRNAKKARINVLCPIPLSRAADIQSSSGFSAY
jgi:hypothetical protein